MAPKSRNHQDGRQHVTTACSECRSSKLKCDGEQPQCGRCKLKNKDCDYRSRDDKRRIPYKRTLEFLKNRVVQLESFIASHGLIVPEVREDDCDVHEKLAPSLKALFRAESDVPTNSRSSLDLDCPVSVDSIGVCSPSQRQPRAEGPHDSADTVSPMEDGNENLQGQERAAITNENMDDWVLDILNMTEGPALSGEVGCFQASSLDCGDALGAQTMPVPLSEIEEPRPTGPSDPSDVIRIPFKADSETAPCYHDFSEDDDELVLQLSNRMGDLHLTKDGISRFYGATSNFNFARWKSSSGADCQQHVIGQAQLEQTKLDDATLSLERELEELYFCWQDSAFHAIDRNMYQHGKKLWREEQQTSSFYSPLLTNAICTFGALFHGPGRSSVQLAETYELKAKALLELESDCPKVSTVQALVALSTFEAASNRDARGWLYCGMAMRLAFDLGLHVDMTPYVLRGDMTHEEAKSRRTAFWGCYIVDHLWGFYMGRPFNTNASNITVERPWPDNLKPHSPWRPCGADVVDQSDKESSGMPNQVELISEKWVTLCGLMDVLGDVMYGCNSASQSDLLMVAESTLAELAQWRESLPAELQIDVDDTTNRHLPHLILLHMQYHQIIIYIYRPFLSTGSMPSPSSIGSQCNDPRAMCIDSAVAISKLINHYERLYTLRRINIQAVSVIFSASLLLLFATLSAKQDDDRVDYVAHLDVCAHALAEMGEYYENATRSLDLLLSIKRDWKAHLVSGGSLLSKRRRSIRPAEDASPHKHFRLNVDAATGNGSGISGSHTVGDVDVGSDQMFGPGTFDGVDWRYALQNHHRETFGA